VSLALATRTDFPWRRVPGYILAQLIGAALACLLLGAMFGKVGMLGATEPGPGIRPPGDGYVVGPLLGAGVAVGLAWLLRGRSGASRRPGRRREARYQLRTAPIRSWRS